AQAGGISIAVLPFTNMSGDAGQEFFSDGMTEEITSALAKVQGLRVIGRTSAFQFKGPSQDLRAIGQALSVGYLIEGSVPASAKHGRSGTHGAAQSGGEVGPGSRLAAIAARLGRDDTLFCGPERR